MPKKKKFNAAAGRRPISPLLAPGYTEQAEDLFEACRKGDLKTVKKLVKAGVNINSQYVNGTTAITYAIQGGVNTTPARALSIIHFLLSKGADVNQPDCSYNALHYAVMWNYREIAGILLNKGAKVDAPSPHGDTALMFAVMHNYVDLARLLIDHGADLSAKRHDGRSIIRMAGDRGQCGEAIEVFLSYPAQSERRREVLAEKKQAAAEATTVLGDKIAVGKPLQLKKPANLTPSSGAV